MATPPNTNETTQIKNEITKSYLDLIQQNLSHHTTFTPGPERDRLIKVLTPAATNGALIGIIQFALLRRAPILWMNRTLRTKYPQGVPSNYNWKGNPQLVKPLKSGDPPTYKPPFHAVTTPLSILFDMTLSVVTASALSLGLVNQTEFLNICSTLPLRGGTSPVSSVLCDDFVTLQKEQLLDTKKSNFWKEQQDKDEVLSALNTFIQNCKRRQLYEDRLRKERLLDDEERVILPMEGVPEDVVLEEREEFNFTEKRGTEMTFET